jgi:hypothetical protein
MLARKALVQATSVCGLKLLVYETSSYYCMRSEATSVCSLIVARKALAQALIGPDGRMHATMPDICRHYGVVIRDSNRASRDVEALAEWFPHLLTTLQHQHNVHTWGQLQRFMDQEDGGGGGVGVGATAGNPLGEVLQTLPQNSPPYDAAAPLGSHPFDSPTRKWNGNMSGPLTRNGKPMMTSPLNYRV